MKPDRSFTDSLVGHLWNFIMSIIFLSFHAEKTGISLSSGKEACNAILGGTFSVLLKQFLK